MKIDVNAVYSDRLYLMFMKNYSTKEKSERNKSSL